MCLCIVFKLYLCLCIVWSQQIQFQFADRNSSNLINWPTNILLILLILSYQSSTLKNGCISFQSTFYPWTEYKITLPYDFVTCGWLMLKERNRMFIRKFLWANGVVLQAVQGRKLGRGGFTRWKANKSLKMTSLKVWGIKANKS